MHIKMGLVEQEGHILLIESNLAAVAQVCAQVSDLKKRFFGCFVFNFYVCMCAMWELRALRCLRLLLAALSTAHSMLLFTIFSATTTSAPQQPTLLSDMPLLFSQSFHPILVYILLGFHHLCCVSLMGLFSPSIVPSASASVAVAAAHSQMLLIARDSANSEQVNAIQSLLKSMSSRVFVQYCIDLSFSRRS